MPTPVPRTQMVVGTNVHDQNFEMVQQMGFPWVKLYADWDTTDPNNVIRLVDGARARYPGVKILLRIDKSPAGARTGNNDDLFRAVADTVGEVTTQYIIRYSPETTDDKKPFRKIEVKLNQPNVIIRARKGYYRYQP